MSEQHNRQPTPEEFEEAKRMWRALEGGEDPEEDFIGGGKSIKPAGREVKPVAEMNEEELQGERYDLKHLLGVIEKFEKHYPEEVGLGMTLGELEKFVLDRLEEIIRHQLAKKHPAQGEKL